MSHNTQPRTTTPPEPVPGATWIPLTKGVFALVDDVDSEWALVSKWSLSNSGYAQASRGGCHIFLHRSIAERMGHSINGSFVDHISGDRQDNRRANLRAATIQENGRNRGATRVSKSGIKCVYWSVANKKWRSTIEIGGKSIHVGYFKDIDKAAAAQQAAEAQYYGEFSVHHRGSSK